MASLSKFPKRHIVLLVAIFVFLLMRPLSDQFAVGKLVMTGLLSLVFLASVWSITATRKKLWTGVSLGLITVLFVWADVLVPVDETEVPKLVIAAVFLFFMIAVLLAGVLKSPQVTADSVCGGISAYLLIGILWADLYAIADILDSETFDVSYPDWHDFIYFSYVTLTTLGYGEIVPRTDLGKTLAYLEAVVGTLFVAVLISALVAQYISNPPARDPEDEA